jgi:hypothetical protein
MTASFKHQCRERQTLPKLEIQTTHKSTQKYIATQEEEEGAFAVLVHLAPCLIRALTANLESAATSGTTSWHANDSYRCFCSFLQSVRGSFWIYRIAVAAEAAAASLPIIRNDHCKRHPQQLSAIPEKKQLLSCT